MTLEKRDVVIVFLCAVVCVQLVAGSVMSGIVSHVRATSVSVADAERIMSINERVMAVNEACLAIRNTAGQSLIRSLLSPEGIGHGEVRNTTVVSSPRLRGVRVASGSQGAE